MALTNKIIWLNDILGLKLMRMRNEWKENAQEILRAVIQWVCIYGEHTWLVEGLYCDSSWSGKKSVCEKIAMASFAEIDESALVTAAAEVEASVKPTISSCKCTSRWIDEACIWRAINDWTPGNHLICWDVLREKVVNVIMLAWVWMDFRLFQFPGRKHNHR